jgi:hypothetical protein
MLTQQERSSRNKVVFTLGAWFAAVVLAALSGALKMLPAEARGALILAGIALPTLAYFRSQGLQQLAERVGIRRITAFHGWRIAAGLGFLWYLKQGLMPARFAGEAGWGDIIAGAAGLLVAWFWARPAGYLTAHLIGLADFVVAVSTGMAMTRANPQLMHAAFELPGALIPLFGVGVTCTTHFVALHLLRKEARGRVSFQSQSPVGSIG